MINGMKQDIHNSLIEQVRISLLKIIKSSVSDFTIESNDAGSDVLIMAIHGGKIEPGTTELARNLSRKYNYNYYSFVGKKSNHNASLHITSTDFREPKAIEMSARSSATISIHGCAGSNQFTYIGGRDDDLGMKIKAALEKNGFTVLAAAPGLSGKS
ncbi:MAG TPA: poly-gamma-glutamate hydrolase family protein, partial [Clostridia bacterium]|nr:poly-gamma-glutamate hydrolase family protein [Clostridia bacterium]